MIIIRQKIQIFSNHSFDHKLKNFHLNKERIDYYELNHYNLIYECPCCQEDSLKLEIEKKSFLLSSLSEKVLKIKNIFNLYLKYIIRFTYINDAFSMTC